MTKNRDKILNRDTPSRGGTTTYLSIHPSIHPSILILSHSLFPTAEKTMTSEIKPWIPYDLCWVSLRLWHSVVPIYNCHRSINLHKHIRYPSTQSIDFHQIQRKHTEQFSCWAEMLRHVLICAPPRRSQKRSLSERTAWPFHFLAQWSLQIAASSAPLTVRITAVNSNTLSRCNQIFSASFSVPLKGQVAP